MDSLKDSGYQILFYPMLFLDLPGKPWRGHINADDPDYIYEFFNKYNGYNAFILHYAELLKGKIDGFIIGSELKNLTQVVDNEYNYPDQRHYPAVSELISLAQKVREIVGNDTVITYAADWSEYHHDNFGYHHLDSLWASEYIDVVGIDAYFPVTNKQKGDISLSEIKQGFESGEFWDYYYDNNEKKPLSPEWAVKQIEYWWGNEHYSSGIKSEWQPKMKPIWFTEFGFPSIHMATNQPNVFWNPDSVDGGVPKYSSGKPDFALQMRAIRAMLEHFQEKSEMVQNMFLWAWDARPYPAYPERLDLWSDGGLWSRSHSINGKIEPLGVVTILPNFNVSTLLIYADKLIIDSSLNNNAKLIIANHVAFKNPVLGINLGIRAGNIQFEDPVNIKLSGTLLLDSDSDILFNSQKIHLTSSETGEKHTINYVDEIINQPLINVDKLIIKAPKLRIASGKITASQIELNLKDLELVSEIATSSYYLNFVGTPNLLTGKSNKATTQHSEDKALITQIKCDDLSINLANMFYSKAAFIEANHFVSHAAHYSFEAMLTQSHHEHCAKQRKLLFKVY